MCVERWTLSEYAKAVKKELRADLSTEGEKYGSGGRFYRAFLA